MIERTVVINLARRADRLSEFRAHWAASGWEEVLGTPVVVEGVDGQAADVPAGVDPGVFGCWASHVAVLASAVEDDVATLAVFEDDAVPMPDSSPWLRALLSDLPEVAAGVWLDAGMPGLDNALAPLTFGAARLLHPPLRTHAYILGRALIKHLHEVVSQAPAPIDRQYMTATRGFQVFASLPSLAMQSSSPSDTLSDWQREFSEGPQRSKAVRWLRRLSPMV